MNAEESRNEWHRQLVQAWELELVQKAESRLRLAVEMQKIAADPAKVEEYLNG